jgi:hypothetical protein
MFIRKIRNWLLSGEVILHMSHGDEGKMVFVNKRPTASVQKNEITTAKPQATPAKKAEYLGKQLAKLKRFLKDVRELAENEPTKNPEKKKNYLKKLKEIENAITKLDKRYESYIQDKKALTGITLGNLNSVDKALGKHYSEFTKGEAWVDPGLQAKPVVNTTKKTPVVPAGSPSSTTTRPSSVRNAKTPAKRVKVKKQAEKKGKGNDNLEEAIENKASNMNEAAKAVRDLLEGEGVTAKGEIALKGLFTLMQTDKKMNRLVLPKSYTVKSIDNETGKEITRKDELPYNAVIKKSTGGQYFKITITPNPGFDYAGPRELYLVAKDGNVQLRAKHQLDQGKIKFEGKEKTSEVPSKEAELSNLLSIIENEGERGFQRYSRDKIDRKSGKPSGPGRLKELMQSICGNEVGNNKLIKLPNGYSIFAPKWNEPYGKAEQIIMKGSQIIAMQMKGGNLKYAPEVGENEIPGIARRAAEVVKSRVFLPKILGRMKFRGEGEFQKPYFSSVEDLNHLKDVLISFAKNAKAGVDQVTLNYDGGMTVHYESDGNGQGLFTMEFGNGFEISFDTLRPNEFGLPASDGNDPEAYSDHEMIPTFKEENQERMQEESIAKTKLIKAAKDKAEEATKVKAKVKAKRIEKAKQSKAIGSLNKVSGVRKDILQKMKGSMGKMSSISTITDTWTSIEKQSKTKVNDAIKHPARYTLSRGKFVFQIKPKSEMNSSERRLVKKTKIHELLQLKNGPLKGRSLRVTIVKANGSRVRGTRYPGDKTVYELGKPRIDKNRLKFAAGDTIKVTMFTDPELKAQREIPGVLKKRESLIKSVSKKKSKLGNKLTQANTKLANFIKSHKKKEGWSKYKGANLLDAWPKKIQLAKYVPLMEKQVSILKELDKNV